MLILLVSTLIVLMSGATGEAAIPDFKKHVKKFVADDERKEEIFDILDVHKGKTKELGKKLKPLKVFWELSRKYETEREELNELLNQARILRSDYEKEVAKESVVIKSLIKEKEWQKILSIGDVAIQKQQNKKVKKVKSYDKAISNLVKVIQSTIADEDRLASIEVIIDEHQIAYKSIFREWGKINYKDHPVLRDLDATEEQHMAIAKEVDKFRWDYFSLYLNDRDRLKAQITATEWNAIIKKFNDLYK